MLATQCSATALFLIPVAALWLLRLGRATAAWELALDVPLAIAVDALATLALARLLPLETSILAVRAAWIVALLAIALRRGRSLAWPARLGGRFAAALLAGAALAAALGLAVSRRYTVWDRPWHAPLVPSLGGQTLPFVNVYGAAEPLHYHLAGDVVAASLRALSLASLSSNAALSLAHDVLFGLTALTVGLLVIGAGVRRALPVISGGAALLLHGPIPLRQGLGEPFQGYSYHLFFSLSYRPHVPVAALMLAGLLGALSVRAARPGLFPPRRAIPVLLATTALLAISDEATLGLVGLGIAAAWIFFPRILAEGRLRGIGALAALGAAALIPNLLFSGSIAPGGPVQRIAWSARAMVPSVVGEAPLPLSSPRGALAFLLDSLPFLACWTGLAAAAIRRPARPLRPLVLLAGAVIAASCLLALHVRVNGASSESQRFFVAPFLVTLLWGLLHLDRMPPRSLARTLVLLGLAVPPIFSLWWLREIAPDYMRAYEETEANPWAKETTYGLDCRRVAGARLGERPRPTYVDSYQHYVFTSCRPIFGPGRPQPPWTTKTLPRFESREQLRELAAMVGNADLDAICAAAPGSRRDPVCAHALARGRDRCTPEGTRFLRCPLSPSDRAAILRR